MNHLGLFEGIGGFSIAAEAVGWETKAWLEFNPFCQTVLKYHFPAAFGFGDVKKFTYAIYKSVLRHNGVTDRSIDIITGGFPCQPFSHAGERRGTDDDRYLWPENKRVIEEFKPRVVVLENVAGLLSILQPGTITEVEIEAIEFFYGNELQFAGNERACEELEAAIKTVEQRVIATIIRELEEIGYVLPQHADGTPVILCMPACATGAPHQRDRVWIIAYRSGKSQPKANHERQKYKQKGRPIRDKYSAETGNVTHGADNGRKQPGRTRGGRTGFENGISKHNPDFEKSGLEGGDAAGRGCSDGRNSEYVGWSEHWLEAATRLCGVDDGLSGGLDTKAISAVKWRKESLKAYGNAIVPQVAIEIFKAIKETDKGI